VPNIKGADQLDLVGMASALTVLVDRAREGTTTPNEMIGTTLSITNVGPFGVDAAIPILPPGTGAILAVGQMPKRRGWLTTRWSCAKWSSWPWPSITARSTGRWPQRYSRTSVGSCTTPAGNYRRLSLQFAKCVERFVSVGVHAQLTVDDLGDAAVLTDDERRALHLQ